MSEAYGIRPGRPDRLGATAGTDGVNFAVYSEHATEIAVCLFDEPHGPERQRLTLPVRSGFVHHGFVPGLRPGQLYGLRARGAYDPGRGLRSNDAKLLIDPYARALAGDVDWSAPLRGYAAGDTAPDPRDDAHGVPKGVVMGDGFDWRGDTRPNVPWNETVIYETHVKGFTYRHPEVAPEVRGTYAGLASPPAVAHLKALGVTAVELLPVHARIDREGLVRRGLVNYWGYDSIGFFAPDARFSSSGERGGQVDEFKQMVRELHRHGIEVLLDVVYNHTAEGDETGPTISFRGLDNSTYYLLDAHHPNRYVNYTGTGNTVQARHPQVLRLIMDSLRYWVEEMHVDGFRFDLAPALAREPVEVSRFASFLHAVHQDPSVSRVKLIAEPWDMGHGGYQLGRFPEPWAEWNDRYRDAVRRYWRGDDSHTPDMAYRLTGSSDVFQRDGRHPYASINFVTAHDGFTLHDLVSYTTKRNQANGENNRDGRDANLSWNCGVEGPTKYPGVIALRQRQKRNFLATLLLSQGVPMILGGDEIGRTQFGNNNAYCQDNEVSWYDWDLAARDRELLEFTQRLTRVRRAHPSLRRRAFLTGGPASASLHKDVTWLTHEGREMTDREWYTHWLRDFGLRLDGTLAELDAQGTPIVDDDLLLLLNASDAAVPFVLTLETWSLVLDTARPDVPEDSERFEAGGVYDLQERSLVLLRHARAGDEN